jgi:hypothetical protein
MSAALVPSTLATTIELILYTFPLDAGLLINAVANGLAVELIKNDDVLPIIEVMLKILGFAIFSLQK